MSWTLIDSDMIFMPVFVPYIGVEFLDKDLALPK